MQDWKSITLVSFFLFTAGYAGGDLLNLWEMEPLVMLVAAGAGVLMPVAKVGETK
jgi:hypothetical protein